MSETDYKVAIVSGGATLIGQKIVEAFHARGVRVVIADINVSDGEAFASGFDDSVIFQLTDITVDSQIDACIARTLEAFDRLDYLVNVACTYLDNGAASTREEWLTALDVNVVGAMIFTQKAQVEMQSRGGGAVVNFGSIAAKRAQPGRMLYSTSKAAILGMTRCQALAFAGSGVRVNSVSPGWTWSNVIRDLSSNNRTKADAVAEPFHLEGRLVDAEEVAETVVYLCSDAASGINGTDIAVDGGYTAIGPEQKTDKVSKLAE